MRILVTGAAGSIGQPLVSRLVGLGHSVRSTDIDELDVLDPLAGRWIRQTPRVVYHLAGAKQAPEGEEDPHRTAELNIIGTASMLGLAKAARAKLILASTCKACDPETVYGASKLIAERMVMNAGGVVVRYYNVRETSGNVFRTWKSIPAPLPIPWTDCWRYFISLEQALELAIAAIDLPPGRYTVNPGTPWHMREQARALYPHRELVQIPRRRGDRRQEPKHARCERIEWLDNGIGRIIGAHDPATDMARERVAA